MKNESGIQDSPSRGEEHCRAIINVGGVKDTLRQALHRILSNFQKKKIIAKNVLFVDSIMFKTVHLYYKIYQ